MNGNSPTFFDQSTRCGGGLHDLETLRQVSMHHGQITAVLLDAIVIGRGDFLCKHYLVENISSTLGFARVQC